ncbi:MAG: tryptophan synthase subunit alpha [Candidatus Melainabacteria bacterium]|nr:MAG: tryptophan synthase subunit alpha [Candidatus Melainabacteria bacterium]
MSKRYERRFEKLKTENVKAFMPFTVLGWPNKEKSLAIIKTMIESGASALELGFPFSDPVADGPVIAKAAFDTLESGFKTADAFFLISEVRKIDGEIPIGILVYYNNILAFGVEAFFQQAKVAGIDGVLIADLPVESADEVLPIAKANDVDLIFIVSPVTTEERLAKIATNAGGFIYLVSRLGVTGTDKSANNLSNLKSLIGRLKSQSPLPICAGFGVSNKQTATALLEVGVDGVIVGSRVIEVVNQSGDQFSVKLAELFKDLADACTEKLATVSTD